MAAPVHELPAPGSKSCDAAAEGDVFTASADAVTCPACLARHGSSPCPSQSARHGWPCVGRRGHGGLHHAEVQGRAYAWTDDSSPELSIDLLRSE